MSNGLFGPGVGVYRPGNKVYPPNWTYEPRPPTQNDNQGYVIGDFWMDTSATPEPEPWLLVSLAGNITSSGSLAHWIRFAGPDVDLQTLTGNTGGPVAPTDNNINIVGDNITIDVVGNPATSTLTISTIGDGVVSSLTGDDGTPVFPIAGNIDVLANTVGGTMVFESGGAGILELLVTDNALNTIIGNSSGSQVTITTAASNTGLGYEALNVISSGTGNVSIGTQSMMSATTAVNNSVVGYQAGDAIIDAFSNCLFGKESGTALTSGSSNVALGTFSLDSLVSGDSNIAIGSAAGTNLTGAESNNILIRSAGITGRSDLNIIDQVYSNYFEAGAQNENNFLGKNAGNFTTTGGGGNVALGESAMQDLAANPSGNVAVGTVSGRRITTGTTNTLVGASAGYDSGASLGLTTGISNILIGYTAASAYRGAESNNIIIGNLDAVVGENNTFRVGGDGGGTLTRSFIQGIRGVTTDVNDAISVLIDSAGQLGTTSSSVRFKDNIEDMGDESSAIMSLRPVKFNYKESSALQTGLIAEEVFHVMPRLVVHNRDGLIESVKYHELPALLLNELQKLQKRVAELESRLN